MWASSYFQFRSISIQFKFLAAIISLNPLLYSDPVNVNPSYTQVSIPNLATSSQSIINKLSDQTKADANRNAFYTEKQESSSSHHHYVIQFMSAYHQIQWGTAFQRHKIILLKRPEHNVFMLYATNMLRIYCSIMCNFMNGFLI